VIRKRMLALVLALSLLPTAALAGCQTKTAAGDKEQYMNVAMNAEPGTLDPSRATDTYSSIVISEVEEALTRCEQDEKGKDVIKPAGAESWTVSDDGLTWTFKLRENKWSDGQEVKASDYVYSIKRTLNPATASSYTGMLSPVKGADAYAAGKGNAEDVGVKAADDKTLVFTLESPCAYFLDLTYFRLFTPQRQDYVEKYGDSFGSEADTMPSCGPFVLKSWTHNSEIVVEKNQNYWDADSVKLSKVTYKILGDEQARMTEILNGTVDIGTAESKEWKDKFDGTGNFDTISGYEPATECIIFNTKDKMFASVKIRKAVSAAIDREKYVETLYPSTRIAAYSFCPPTLQIGTEEFRTKAASEPVKKLLEEVTDPKVLFAEGLNELGLGSDPSKITIAITAAGPNAKTKQVAEYNQQMFQEALGCKVEIKYVDPASMGQTIGTGDFQMVTAGWTGDYNDPMTEFDVWTSHGGLNYGRWSNEKYDKNIEAAAATQDQDKRLAYFKECEDILVHQDAAIAPLDFKQRSQYKRKYVKGYMSTLFGSSMELKYAYTQGR
jgi:oligopeptide transport system substrate-binding protein